MSYMKQTEFAPVAGIQELCPAEINEVGGAPVGAIVRAGAWLADKAAKAYKSLTSKQVKAAASTGSAIAEYGPSGSTPQN